MKTYGCASQRSADVVNNKNDKGLMEQKVSSSIICVSSKEISHKREMLRR